MEGCQQPVEVRGEPAAEDLESACWELPARRWPQPPDDVARLVVKDDMTRLVICPCLTAEERWSHGAGHHQTQDDSGTARTRRVAGWPTDPRRLQRKYGRKAYRKVTARAAYRSPRRAPTSVTRQKWSPWKRRGDRRTTSVSPRRYCSAQQQSATFVPKAYRKRARVSIRRYPAA